MHEELFSRSGLSLDRLKTLCTVAEQGGIAKAAEGDPVRQSQFSRQLRELGEFFEVELTRRRGKGVELTLAGRELAALSREILEALSEYRRGQRGGDRVLRLGAGESLIQWHVLPRLKQLQAEMPLVLLSMSNLRSQEIVTQLSEAQIDFGLVGTDELPAGIESAKLGTLRYCICVPSAVARGLTWRQALHLPMVGLEGEGSLMRKLRKVTEQAGVVPKPAVLCSSLPGVAAALKEIEGYAILPEAAEKNGLVAIDAPFLREFDRTIRLAWSVRRLAIREEMNRWRKKLTAILAW